MGDNSIYLHTQSFNLLGSRISVFILMVFFVVLSLGLSERGVSHAQDFAWSSGGPGGGDVNSIAVSHSNPNIFYVGTVSGVYKSKDGGDNWSPAGLQGIKIEVVRVDPEDANMVYAGADIENGFFRSTSGGNSWTQGSIDRVLAMDVDPANPATLWTGTSSGIIYKSEDRGETWERKLGYHDEVPIYSIIVDPGNSNNVFAGTDFHFLKSTEGGETGTWNHTLTTKIAAIAMTPANVSPVIYAMVYSDDVYKSTDLGESWTKTDTPFIGYRGGALAVDKHNPEVIYVGTHYYLGYFYKSTDSGNSWSIKAEGLPEFLPQSISVCPQDGDIFVGLESAGLYKSKDAAENWIHSSAGINNSTINNIAIDPLASDIAFAALRGHIQKTETGGASWSQLDPTSPVDVYSITVDSANPDRMFAGTKGYDWSASGIGRIYRSHDGGKSWARTDPSPGDDFEYQHYTGTINDIWIHPADPDTILTLREYRQDFMYHYLGCVRRSTDGGDSWVTVKEWNWPNRLASDPNNPDIVYLGVERLGYVFRSDDAGENWENISPYQHWANNVYDVAVDSDSNVYAAVTDYEDNELGGIWKWDQAEWTHIKRFDNTEVTSLAIDLETNPNTLYAGTSDSGVYVSINTGNSWVEFNEGLEILSITSLEISKTEPRILYAGTEYGGVWSVLVQTLEYDITLTTSPEQGGTVTGEGTFGHGEQVTVEATPSSGWIFSDWTENGQVASTDNPYTFTARIDRNLVANFAKTGSLQIFIDPQEAADAGAQWRIKGTDAWYYSGETAYNVPVGTHTIEFRGVPGWRPEGTIDVTIEADKTVTHTITYLEQQSVLPGVMMLLLDEE